MTIEYKVTRTKKANLDDEERHSQGGPPYHNLQLPQATNIAKPKQLYHKTNFFHPHDP